MNGISAVLIAKNEAKVIARCLKSLQGLGQIVVHDTGSTDGTQDIARSLGADVSETRIEPFHFAKARNEAMMRAKNRWILSIDADEVLRDGSLKALFEGAKNISISAYQIGYENRAVEGGSTMLNPRTVFFQKGRWIWKYRVHERLSPTFPPVRLAALRDCVIEHHPDADKAVRRKQNLDLLKLCVQEDPDYIYAHRQLGLEYVLQEEWAAAIPCLEAHVKSPVDPADAPLERVASRMHLAKCLARAGDLQRAMNEFMKASNEAPKRREPLYWAAIELLRANMPWESVRVLKQCLEIAPEPMPEFSLYAENLCSGAVEETLKDCEAMVAELQARYAAQQKA